MKPLSEFINDELIRNLKETIHNGEFPHVDFKVAMEFILNDGILPKANLPAASFLKLEDWVRGQGSKVVRFSATDLKNKTGLVLQSVLNGNTVHIERHGRAILEMKPIVPNSF